MPSLLTLQCGPSSRESYSFLWGLAVHITARTGLVFAALGPSASQGVWPSLLAAGVLGCGHWLRGGSGLKSLRSFLRSTVSPKFGARPFLRSTVSPNLGMRPFLKGRLFVIWAGRAHDCAICQCLCRAGAQRKSQPPEKNKLPWYTNRWFSRTTNCHGTLTDGTVEGGRSTGVSSLLSLECGCSSREPSLLTLECGRAAVPLGCGRWLRGGSGLVYLGRWLRGESGLISLRPFI